VPGYRSKNGVRPQVIVRGGWQARRAAALLEQREDVGLDLLAVGQGVCLVEKPSDRQDFAQHLAVDAEFSQGSRVRGSSDTALRERREAVPAGWCRSGGGARQSNICGC
jgi:hypothetical protein